MVRSNKKAGGSTRKQPASRRSRQAKVRRTSSAAPASSSLSRGSLKGRAPVPRDPTRTANEPGEPEATEGAERTSAVDGARESQRSTNRPVARSLRPEPSKREESRKTSPLLLALAAAVVGGALWLGLGRAGDEVATSVERAAAVEAPDLPAEPKPAPEAGAEAKAKTGGEAEVETGAEAEAVGVESDPPDEAVETAPPEPSAVRAAPRRADLARRARSPKTGSTQPSRAAQRQVSGQAGPFNQDAASAALSEAAQQASSCRQAGDPTGVARVVVTFAPSGRVTAATIGGPPFAGTETGSCIAKTMRRMSLSPFEGEHVTISKTVVIM